MSGWYPRSIIQLDAIVFPRLGERIVLELLWLTLVNTLDTNATVLEAKAILPARDTVRLLAR